MGTGGPTHGRWGQRSYTWPTPSPTSISLPNEEWGRGDQPKVGGDNVAIPRHLLVLFHSNCLVAAHLWDLLVAAHLWVLLEAAHLWALPVAAHLWDLLVAAHLWDLLVAAHLWDLSPPMDAR